MTIDQPRTGTAFDELVEKLGEVLLTGESVAEYASDSSRASASGLPRGVVLARDAHDVAITLAWATAHRVPVSVRGAGTGLSGGAVGYAGGIVISLAGLTSIIGIEVGDRLIDVQAGVITADIDAAAAPHGLMYAPDPASAHQSTIGGNIATNAGGLRCLKYGVTADSVAALEVVLPTGEIIHTGARTRKNAVGYDLTGLFIGSEGTLGVITAATLRLRPRPVGDTVTFRASFPTLESAGEAVTALAASPIVPEVLELLDRASVEAVERLHPTGLEPTTAAAVLLGQIIGPDADTAAKAAESLFRAAGATSVDRAEGDALLEARRFTGPALSAEGLRVSSDVAVPVSKLAEMFAAIERLSAHEGVAIPTFAHAGDGNLHPSVIVTSDSEAERDNAERILDSLIDSALALGGTASGEHGVGSLKLSALARQVEPESRRLQHQIKAVFDPAGVLSPGRAI